MTSQIPSYLNQQHRKEEHDDETSFTEFTQDIFSEKKSNDDYNADQNEFSPV